MAISNYTELQSAVSNWSHRVDVSSDRIQEFIALAEADLQLRAELTQWDTEASVTITDGAGDLPADFKSMHSVRLGSQDTQLVQVTPQKYDFLRGATDPTDAIYYAIIGTQLRTTPSSSGTASILYAARFTALSASATTNSLLTLFPDAYLYGAMVQFAIWANNDKALQRYGVLYAGLEFPNPHARSGAVGRIHKYTSMRRHGAAPLGQKLG